MQQTVKLLQISTLDQQFSEIFCGNPPAEGWIKSIRKALSMSVRQLGERMGISQQAASRIESNEINDAITLKTLKRAANALDCQLVYAVIPNEGYLQDIINTQARKKAEELVESAKQTMISQGKQVGNVEDTIEKITKDFVAHLDSKLWD